MKKVVLAYSGGLDTSVAIKWLKDKDYEVIAYMADVGQEKTTKAAIDRAKVAGASKVVCIVSGGNIDVAKLARILVGQLP